MYSPCSKTRERKPQQDPVRLQHPAEFNLEHCSPSSSQAISHTFYTTMKSDSVALAALLVLASSVACRPVDDTPNGNNSFQAWQVYLGLGVVAYCTLLGVIGLIVPANTAIPGPAAPSDGTWRQWMVFSCSCPAMVFLNGSLAVSIFLGRGNLTTVLIKTACTSLVAGGASTAMGYVGTYLARPANPTVDVVITELDNRMKRSLDREGKEDDDDEVDSSGFSSEEISSLLGTDIFELFEFLSPEQQKLTTEHLASAAGFHQIPDSSTDSPAPASGTDSPAPASSTHSPAPASSTDSPAPAPSTSNTGLTSAFDRSNSASTPSTNSHHSPASFLSAEKSSNLDDFNLALKENPVFQAGFYLAGGAFNVLATIMALRCCKKNSTKAGANRTGCCRVNRNNAREEEATNTNQEVFENVNLA